MRLFLSVGLLILSFPTKKASPINHQAEKWIYNGIQEDNYQINWEVAKISRWTLQSLILWQMEVDPYENVEIIRNEDFAIIRETTDLNK